MALRCGWVMSAHVSRSMANNSSIKVTRRTESAAGVHALRAADLVVAFITICLKEPFEFVEEQLRPIAVAPSTPLSGGDAPQSPPYL